MTRKFRKLKRKIIGIIKSVWRDYSRYIAYGFVFLIGIIFIILSFYLEEDCKNVFCGVGTGILTSLLVTVIINKENDIRLSRQLNQEKHFIFNNAIRYSIDVYLDFIYRINEYISLNEIEIKDNYELFNDFSPFNDFVEFLKNNKYSDLLEDEKAKIDNLFNFNSYQLNHLQNELKHISTQEYFLKGLLTQKEYKNLFSQYIKDDYLNNAVHMESFWVNKVIDYEKCLQFLRLTIYIVSKVISTFDYAMKEVREKEKNIKSYIDDLYFRYVYSFKEEYILSQIEDEKAKFEYYESHPKELEKLEYWYERTDEDFLLDDLEYCLLGFSESSFEELLKKLDKNSKKVKAFFTDEDIRIVLKKRKYKSVLRRTYGKNYLKDILKTEVDKNGQA